MAEALQEYIISKDARKKITEVNTQDCKKIADQGYEEGDNYILPVSAIIKALDSISDTTLQDECAKAINSQKTAAALLQELKALVSSTKPSPVSPAVTVSPPASAAPTLDKPALVALRSKAESAMDRAFQKQEKFLTFDVKNRSEAQYLSGWRRAIASWMPGFEPTSKEDITDVVYQSKEFNKKLLAHLTTQYQNNDATLPVGYGTNMPGWWPALPQRNIDFNANGGYKGKIGVEGKRLYLIDTMEAIENAWNNASRNPVELFSDMMIDLTGWGGAATILTTAILGRMAYNVATGGSIKKAGPVEAVGWTFGQIWDGAKWVFTGSRTGVTVGGRALVAGGARQTIARTVAGGIVGGAALGTVTGGPIGTAVGAVAGGIGGYRMRGGETVKPQDLKDSPAYTLEEWAKERARLEETTRRMIYMDSGKNPRHNPNATPAEIFQAVENTPALKAAFDARMVKLGELGNTLVGQEKYLSKDAFDKEAGKIVAGDIVKPTVANKVKRSIPFSAEKKEYQETQSALKKVKGEVDTMRARLQAKATIDDVAVPEVLKKQLESFQTAYNAAFEADKSLDKSRNNINRTADRINAINEVVAHFEEIKALQDKINDLVTGINKQMADIKERIATQRPAAHTETEVDRRAREIQGAEAEISVAKEALEQARKDQEKLENEIREAKKESVAAQERINEREGELKKNIKTSSEGQSAANADEVSKRAEWQTELDDRTDELKKRDDAKKTAQDKVDDLELKKPDAATKISDALSEYQTKVGDKRTILGRVGGVDAKSLTNTDTVELEALKSQKVELEGKINIEKQAIDAIAMKPENKGFPRSTGGTLALANAELGRLDALIAPGGLLDATKTTAKVARDTAFTQLNTTIVTLNTESARLGAGLEIRVPHIAEMVKGSGFSDDLSTRADGTTGDKAADHKLKGTRPASVKTVMTGGRIGP